MHKKNDLTVEKKEKLCINNVDSPHHFSLTSGVDNIFVCSLYLK